MPGFKPPYAIAVVQLAEGPRMMSNIVECEQTPEALQLDMPLEVVFEKQNDTISAAFVPSPGFNDGEGLDLDAQKRCRRRRRRRNDSTWALFPTCRKFSCTRTRR